MPSTAVSVPGALPWQTAPEGAAGPAGPALVEEALRPGRRLIARVRLTDAKGHPVCAPLRPPDIGWHTG